MKILIAREKTMHVFHQSGGCFALSLREPESPKALETAPEIALKNLPALRDTPSHIHISFARN